MVRVGTYTLRIMADPSKTDEENQTTHDSLGGALQLAEESINDFLPDGYYCKIDE